MSGSDVASPRFSGTYFVNGVKFSDGAMHTIQEAAAQELWIAGDPSSYYTLAASAVQELSTVDVSAFDWGRTLVQVIVSGTGTAKLTVAGSFDGVHDLHSMGDRLTGMVAATASYILKLSDSNLAWFPFLHFTATETGGANSVNVRARVIGAVTGVS